MNPLSALKNDPASLALPVLRPETGPPSSAGGPPVEAESASATDQAAKLTANRQEQATTSAKPTEKQLDDAVNKLNEALINDGRNLNFSIDKATGMTVVQIRNKETNEVIRQIPSEETLKLARSLQGKDGLIFNEQV